MASNSARKSRRLSVAGRLLGVCLVAAIAATGDAAAAYPDKPVKFVVTFAAGGPADAAARIVATRLTRALKQPFIVENRPGASGSIGTEYVARAPADGYTIAIISGSHSSTPSLYRHLRYDPIGDFAPVTQIIMLPFVLLVHPSVHANSVNELISLARDARLTYGSAGIGSTNHIAGVVFSKMAGIAVVHVPYKGTAPAFADLLAGRISFMFSPINLTLQHIQNGAVRALAVASLHRSPLLPKLPTVAEAGLSGYDIGSWIGALAPAGTAKDVVARLSAEIRKVLRDPSVKDAFLKSGAEPVGSTPQEFAAYMQKDLVKWTGIFKDAGIKPLD